MTYEDKMNWENRIANMADDDLILHYKIAHTRPMRWYNLILSEMQLRGFDLDQLDLED